MSENAASLPEKKLAKLPDGASVHNRGADTLKFLLTPFICFWAFGFPDGMGIVSTLSGFAIPAYFILTGYFVLDRNGAERGFKLKRAVLRSLVTFGVMILCYFLINVALMTLDHVDWMSGLLSKRTLFNFLVLNVWPYTIGNNIWFIQSLLYVYVFLLFVNLQWGLKHYKILMAMSMIFMVAVGELAGLINFNILGYAYIPGGAVTRALPYVLLGMFLREKTKRLSAIRGWVYFLVFALGGGLVIGEIEWLGRMGKLIYRGHMIGYGVMAAALCAWAVSRPKMKRTVFSIHGRTYAKRVYALANPVFYAMLVIMNLAFPQYLGILTNYAGPIVYAVCLLICVSITLVKNRLSRGR